MWALHGLDCSHVALTQAQVSPSQECFSGSSTASPDGNVSLQIKAVATTHASLSESRQSSPRPVHTRTCKRRQQGELSRAQTCLPGSNLVASCQLCLGCSLGAISSCPVSCCLVTLALPPPLDMLLDVCLRPDSAQTAVLSGCAACALPAHANLVVGCIGPVSDEHAARTIGRQPCMSPIHT